MSQTPGDHAPSPPPDGGVRLPSSVALGGVTIGVFAKHWTPGETKTRLAATIGHEAAAAVSRLFIESTLRRLAKARDLFGDGRIDLRLACTPPGTSDQFAGLDAVQDAGWRVQTQCDGSLGARMRGFFEGAMTNGAAAVLVGSDTPHLPVDAVVRAVSALTAPGERRTVFGPTEDGGYWLIGCRGALPPVFGDAMPWSQPALLRETLEKLQAAGWSEGTDYLCVDDWYDIDDASDLNRMRRWLESGQSAADPALAQLKQRLDALLGDSDLESP